MTNSLPCRLRFSGAGVPAPKNLEFDKGGALLGEVEGLGSGVGEVNDATGGRGAAVLDGHPDGLTVAQIGDAEFRAAGESAVGGGELRGGVGSAAGGLVAFK